MSLSIILFISIFLAGYQTSGGQSGGKKLSADDFERQLKQTKEYYLIDVRSPEEFTEGHLKGAENINSNCPDFRQLISRLNKEKPIYVYCLAGSRSAAAAAAMKEMGFREVNELERGILNWQNLNKPIVKGASASMPAAPSMTKEIYDAKVKEKDLVLVDFNAKWCIPCKKMAPVLEEIRNEQAAKVSVMTLDIDANPELAQSLGVQNLPTLILYKKGKIVWKNEEFVEKSVILDAISNK